MKLFNFFRKSTTTRSSSFTQQQFNEMLRCGVNTFTTAADAYNKYNFNSALSDAVDMISTKFASIEPIIKNDKKEIVDNKKAIEILKKPNNLQNYIDFAKDMASNYLIDNNAYLEVQGFYKAKPLGIHNISNSKVNITEGSNRLLYQVNTVGFYQFLSGIFTLNYDDNHIIAKNNIAEIYHTKGFALSNGNGIRGLSKINSINGDIDVLDKSMVQLTSLLKKGFSAGGLMSVDTEDSTSFEQFKKDVANQYSGAGNTGKVLVSKGKSIDYKSLDKTNKENQQIENKKDAKNTIYQRYEIPGPLIDNSAKTYNNYQTALYALYDNAVLPLANKLYSVMTRILQDRKILSENDHITYNESTIPALQLRRNEEIKMLKGLDILTINELRTLANYEAVSEGADDIYINSTQVPIGTDLFVDDNIKKTFTVKLKKFGYAEDEINEYWNEYKSTIR